MKWTMRGPFLGTRRIVIVELKALKVLGERLLGERSYGKKKRSRAKGGGGERVEGGLMWRRIS